jgi:protein-tyrosine phosphatase
MVEVFQVYDGDDPRGAVDRAVSALRAGKLVGFPTETVYGIAAASWMTEAVDRLIHCKGRPENKPLTLALSAPEQAKDWLVHMGSVARRLSRRCWPGPLTLVSKEGVSEGLAAQLPPAVLRHVSPEGALGLRVPAHDAVLEALDQLPGSIILTSANRSGEPDALQANEIPATVLESLDVLIDDGPTQLGTPSTVVEAEGNTWKILREGAISAAALAQRAACMVVFVCTGNTCRSPLAEGLFKKLLSEQLGCRPDALSSKGFDISSAGLAAFPGGEAAPEAITVGGEWGVDLRKHASRVLTPSLAHQADWIVAMTESQRVLLPEFVPGSEARLRLLCAEGTDVADPIGCDLEVYRQCARQIHSGLQRLVPEVLLT